MDTESLQRFRAEVIANRNLPTIPAILSRIVAVVEDETAGSRKLVEVIERDQPLTGKVLRLANSAFFGQARKVATIPRAVLLLGFATVRNLALGVKVWDTIANGVARQRLEAQWQHAVAVATAAKFLASSLRAADPDEAFTAGLLHDVGRLVLARKLGEEYWTATSATDLTTVDGLEREHFGVDHVEVGGWLLEAWNLPPSVVDAARQHHERPVLVRVAGLVAIANRLVELTDLSTGACGASVDEYLAALGDARLTRALWDRAVAELTTAGVLDALG